MNKSDKKNLYKDQGIHVINVILTIQDGALKVLLLKNHEANNYLLIGGSLYNNEDIYYGSSRELEEKTTISDIKLYQANLFSKPYRSLNKRMIAISFFGLVNINDIKIIIDENEDLELFDINNLPVMGYDHAEILEKTIATLKKGIFKGNYLKELLGKEWSMVELRRIFEQLYNKEFDRRNFRKKILSLKVIKPLSKTKSQEKGRPAQLYTFINNIVEDEWN